MLSSPFSSRPILVVVLALLVGKAIENEGDHDDEDAIRF
jgi:hypothetical protein